MQARSSTSTSKPTAQPNEALTRIKEQLRKHGVTVTEGQQGHLGVGTHSTVHRAQMITPTIPKGITVAVKLIDLRRGGEYIDRFMERELQIIKELHHSNIIKVFSIHRSREYVAIMQEFASGGDLLNYIRKKNCRYLSEAQARPLFRQLMEAIMYLERRRIVHRDIKCENIFLDEFENIKLGDFGFTRVLRPGECSLTHCGSRPYAALELLSGQMYNGNAVDIWSTGVVLFVILTGHFPFGGSAEAVEEIVRRQKLQRISFPSRLSQEVRELILKMVHPVTAQRATTQTILKSKWLADTHYIVRTAGTGTAGH